MVDAIGTLWEYRDVRSSFNRGLDSRLCVLFDRHKDEIPSGLTDAATTG